MYCVCGDRFGSVRGWSSRADSPILDSKADLVLTAPPKGESFVLCSEIGKGKSWAASSGTGWEQYDPTVAFPGSLRFLEVPGAASRGTTGNRIHPPCHSPVVSGSASEV